ncbi:hypothetical protein G6F55_014162 [Rhizopus delemar]|nr:hypothetical protein G6F55_014162 [Rhizopus delemar]
MALSPITACSSSSTSRSSTGCGAAWLFVPGRAAPCSAVRTGPVAGASPPSGFDAAALPDRCPQRFSSACSVARAIGLDR